MGPAASGYVEITSPVKPGYSGSPVVDANGEVVAVASKGGDGSTTWGVRLDENITWEDISLPGRQNAGYDPFEALERTTRPLPPPQPQPSPPPRAFVA